MQSLIFEAPLVGIGIIVYDTRVNSAHLAA